MIKDMKIKATLYSLSFLGILGCSQEEIQQPMDSGIMFRVDMATDSKVATDASLHSVFEEGDQVGVYAVLSGNSLAASGNYMDNRILTYSAGEWVLDGDPVYLPKNGSLDIYAYYPYMKDFDPTAYIYDASVKSFDLMSSSALDVKTTTVNLFMEHLLVLVDVNLEGGGTKVTLNNAVSTAVVNLETGVQEGSDRKSLNLKKTGAKSYRHYIPAQTFSAGELFSISAGKSQASYTIASERVFNGGQAYKFNIKSPITDIHSLPNCFIVAPGQSVTIPLVKAYELWRQEAWSTENNLDGSPEPYLLWTDTEGLIPSDGIKVNTVESDWASSTVVVTVAEGKSGNAAIAVKINGACRWVWHIWVTDFDPSATSVKYSDGLEYMDRNVGATTSDYRDVNSYGCYFQGCRAYPFPGPASANSSSMRKIYNASGAEVKINPSGIWGPDQGQSIRRAIKDPLLFVTSGGEPYSWITTDAKATDSAAEFWPGNGNRAKTAYDPCPEGWTLPTYDESGNSPFAELAAAQASASVKLPKSGRLKFNGNFDAGGSATMLWCGDAAGLKTCALYISWDSSDYPKELNPTNNYSRSNALPVRCVKENQ